MPFGLFKSTNGEGGGNGTFHKLKKKPLKGSLRHGLKQSLKSSLGQGVNMRDAVKVPKEQDKNEWIAMNTMEIFNSTTLCWSFVSDFCTPAKCPKMSAGEHYSFLWQDDKKSPKPIDLPAVEYVENLVSWVSEKLDDPNLFPVQGEFPKDFLPTAKKILKRISRIFFHIYYHHWDKIQALKAEGHLNTCFKHFYYFVNEFGLLNEKDLEPMQESIKKLIENRLTDTNTSDDGQEREGRRARCCRE